MRFRLRFWTLMPIFNGKKVFLFFPPQRFYLFIFRERKKTGREKERERNINVWLPLAHLLLGTCPATKECALIGNRTCNPLVCRLALNSLSHTSQGERRSFFKKKNIYIYYIYIKYI